MNGIPKMFRIVFLVVSLATFVAGNVMTMPDEATIRATLNEISGILQTDNDNANLLEGLNKRIQDLIKTIQDLEALKKQENEQKAKVSSLLQKANARQLQDLEDRLAQSLSKELQLREKEALEQEKMEALLEERRSKPPIDAKESDIVVEVTPAALAERLDTDAILGQSEDEMKRWVLSVVENELESFKTKTIELVPESNAHAEIKNSKDCPSLNKIVQSIQQALNEYVDEREDHAQKASVVHWLTSKTYAPLGNTLESVWWNKFIPQDWERLLPEGWEDWPVGIPSYVYHSLGFMSGPVAPPEAVLQKNTLPGSCWPMEGSSGQIVLKLQNPVVVDSIAVDHVSSAILPEGKHTSAPKKVKVIGYPPCDHEASCASAGFDLSDPIEIADFEYDIEGSSVQTFDSYYTQALASVPEPEPSLEAADGSCSVQASCSTPPKQSVAAVEVRVLENWGNFDFTCLYRLRVHGDVEL